MIELTSICEQAAEVLTGQAVRLELVDRIPGRLGQCYKQNGKFIIQMLKKGLYPGFMHVFLHECAHIKLSADQYIDLGLLKAGGGGGAEDSDPDPKDEEEAERLATAWLSFADRNAWLFEGSQNLKRLQVLINIDAIKQRQRI